MCIYRIRSFAACGHRRIKHEPCDAKCGIWELGERIVHRKAWCGDPTCRCDLRRRALILAQRHKYCEWARKDKEKKEEEEERKRKEEEEKRKRDGNEDVEVESTTDGVAGMQVEDGDGDVEMQNVGDPGDTEVDGDGTEGLGGNDEY